MDTLVEVFVTKVWAIAVDQADAISRFGRRVLMTANQIRNLARQGRNRIYTLAQIRTMTNKPVIFIDEPPAPEEACKRLHTGEYADAAMRLAYEEAIAQGFNDLTVDCNDKVSIMEASNCGNLYCGNVTTGIKMASNNGELYGINNDVAGIASNGGNLYGGNGTTGIKMASNNGELYGINNDVAGIASNGGNLYGGNGTTGINKMASNNDELYGIKNDEVIIIASNGGIFYGGNGTTSNSKMASDNDDLMVTDDDTISIGSASNGGN